MPIDGVVVRNIVKELNSLLIDGRIDKITQPEVDEINIIIRNNGQNYKLLLSSSPTYPRVHITTLSKQSPINAPMFCMVLRKHISGGRIVRIEQYNLDRIIKIYIEAYDELGSLSNKILVCEIMGRHSNIILVSEGNGVVIDSIKHVTPDISSFRQVLPGITYKYPPFQNKLEPLNFSMSDFENRLESAPSGTKLAKFISNTINGISIFGAREICYNTVLDEDIALSGLSPESKQRLLSSVKVFIDRIAAGDFSPCLYFEGSELYDFYSFDLNYLKHMKLENKQSISDTIEIFYYRKDKSDRIKQRSADILKIVKLNLDRCLKKLSIQNEKLIECQGKDKWKLYGDLITANLYSLKKGDPTARVINYYDENQDYMNIPLDLSLTPPQNAQRYYKKYNKEKTAEEMTKEQKKENLEEIQYLENQLVNIENCTEDEEIEEIRNELISLGYIKKKRKTSSRKIKQSKPMHYVSSDGTDIYVGKNNVQNDYLTTKFAEPGDIWLHTKNIPGSHVIIKSGSPSDSTLLEAAALSAYYSKAKNSSNVPVDYTDRKNVKKPSGAKPGMVIYYTNRTVYVTPDEEMINKLKQV